MNDREFEVTLDARAAPPPLRIDANISMLFEGQPLEEQLRAAIDSGFCAVELWWPFLSPLPTRAEISALLASFDSSGLEVVCLNTAGGDFAKGWRGLASLTGEQETFRKNMAVASELAADLGARNLNVLYGNTVPGLSPSEQRRQGISSLRYAAEIAAKRDQVVLIEALNVIEYPNYPIHRRVDVDEVLAPIRADGLDNVAMLADTHHLALGGEDLLEVFSAPKGIGHVQISDVPGRSSPGTGSLPFSELFSTLRDSGYRGFIGCEYQITTLEPFSWVGVHRESVTFA